MNEALGGLFSAWRWIKMLTISLLYGSIDLLTKIFVISLLGGVTSPGPTFPNKEKVTFLPT